MMTAYQQFLATKQGCDPNTLKPDFGLSVEEFDAAFGTSDGHHYIYGLLDPRTGELRYVGKTDSPRRRLTQHLREDRGTHRCNWVQSIRKAGMKPVMAIIDATAPGSDWVMLERLYIAAARTACEMLTNGTDGGEGVSGLAPETRARLAAAARGRKHSAETRAKMSAAKKGRPQPEAWKQLMREICRGRPLPRELAEANRRRMQKLTDDQVRQIRRLLAAGASQSSIAPQFGVSAGTISNIAIGRTYSHVQDEEDGR